MHFADEGKKTRCVPSNVVDSPSPSDIPASQMEIPPGVELGYAQGWTAGGNSAGDVLISGAEYSLEGDVIQFFEVAEEYRR